MAPRHPNFPEENLEDVARKIEAAFTAVNARLLKVAGVDADGLVEAFTQVQSKMLGFDPFATSRFREAVEQARVKTYSQGNVFMACVLCSAIALSEFKKQPRKASSRWSKPLSTLRAKSTNAVSLGVFATASLYALLGSNGFKKLTSYVRSRPHTLK